MYNPSSSHSTSSHLRDPDRRPAFAMGAPADMIGSGLEHADAGSENVLTLTDILTGGSHSSLPRLARDRARDVCLR